MTRGIPRPVWVFLLLLGAAALVAPGCNKAKDTGSDNSQPPPGGPGEQVAGGPGMPGPNSADVLSKLPGGPEHAVGKKVYADNNCARCHKLGETGGGMGGMKGPPGGMMPPGGPPGGPGGGGPPEMKGPPGGGKGPGRGMSGPDLSTVGANPEHTEKWLADHIRDPKSHKPGSRMPAFGPEKISDADLGALAAYLASRK